MALRRTAPGSISELVYAGSLPPGAVAEVEIAPELVKVPRAARAAVPALLLAAAALCVRLDLHLIYSDSRSHLVIARRTFDSLYPGLAQLGTVWLPLPHVMLIPLVAIGGLYHTGLAGTVVGLLMTAYGAFSTYRLVHLWTANSWAAGLALAAYLANPNLLYAQSTPLTEPVFLGFFAGALFHLSAWMKTLAYKHLIVGAALTTAASLCRYDGWALAAVGCAVVLVVALRRTGRGDAAEAMTIAFGVLSCFGMLVWFFYNFTIVGDPLAFQHGQYSAEAQQSALAASGRLPSKGHLGVAVVTYLWHVIDVAGAPRLIAGAVGWAVTLIGRVDRLPAVALLALTSAPLLLNVLALYGGQTVIAVPETAAIMSPVATGLNSRMLDITVKPPSRYSALVALKNWPASRATMVPKPSPVRSKGTKLAVMMNRHCSRNSCQ